MLKCGELSSLTMFPAPETLKAPNGTLVLQIETILGCVSLGRVGP